MQADAGERCVDAETAEIREGGKGVSFADECGDEKDAGNDEKGRARILDSPSPGISPREEVKAEHDVDQG
jgi:hypothetical protein